MNEIITTTPTRLNMTGNGVYDTFVRDFNYYLSGRPVTFELVQEYMEHCKVYYKQSSLGCIKSALKKAIVSSLGRSGRDMLLITTIDMAFKDIKTGKIDRKIYSEKILSEEEVEHLVSNLNPKVSLIVKTLAISGMRVSELCTIKLEDCRVEEIAVFIDIVGKGSKQRRVFLPLGLFAEIKEVFRGEVYLFETTRKNRYTRHYIWREVKIAGRELLNREISPHTFRHSFCTTVLLEKKKSLKAVSQYVGHSSTSITADMYIHDELKPEDLF